MVGRCSAPDLHLLIERQDVFLTGADRAPDQKFLACGYVKLRCVKMAFIMRCGAEPP
jgi:hypothetical protein